MHLKPLRQKQSPCCIFTTHAGLALPGDAIRLAQLEAAVAEGAAADTAQVLSTGRVHRHLPASGPRAEYRIAAYADVMR